MVTKEKFSGLTGVVIDNFEGGYYHPDMLKNFKPSDQAKLKSSGETMFGLDRKAGAQLAQFPDWKKFWSRVDAEKAASPSAWKYNSRGGSAGADLKNLAAAIMYQWFSILVKKYITVGGNEAIGKDDRLVIHFSYASWNGEGWFKKFAVALNSAIQKFHEDKEAIFHEAIKARTAAVKKTASGAVVPNVVIRQQGANMMKLFKKMGLV
jgi:hypothetical protein